MDINGSEGLLTREQKAIELVAQGKRIKKSVVRGGKNSKIIRLRTENNEMDIAIKFYRKQKLEGINRQERERKFIELAKKTKAKDCVPSILMEKEDDWTAFYWIEGTRMRTVEEADIETITTFIENINQKTNEKGSGAHRVQNAVDALTTIESLTGNIKQRTIEIIESTEIAGKGEFRNWMIKKVIQEGMQRVNKAKEDRIGDNYFKDMKQCQILSPSDVGVHNTIRTREGLVFLDFEYSGYDDLAKMTCDWVLQPEYPLNRKKEELLIEGLENMDIYANKSKDWINRYYATKKIYHFKWCLIIYKCMCITKKIDYDEQKLWNYFNKWSD